MSDIGSIIIIVILSSASSSSCLAYGGEVIAGMTLDEIDSVSLRYAILYLCRQATRTVAVRG